MGSRFQRGGRWHSHYSASEILARRHAGGALVISWDYTQAFALRGLATLKDARAWRAALALAQAADADVRLRAWRIRAFGPARGSTWRDAAAALIRARTTPANLVLEIHRALGRR
jgi:hypothetical protein